MSGAIGPGSLLLAVDDGGEADGYCPLPKLVVGRVYECLAYERGVPGIHEPCSGCGSRDGIALVEIGFVPEWAYCICTFVPAGRRGDFAANLNVEPIREDA